MQQLASDNRRITTWLHLGPHDTKGINIQLDDLLMVVGPHIPKVVRGRLSTLTLPHFVYVDQTCNSWPVDGTRSVRLRLRCTVLGTPYTFSFGSELFSP